MRDADREARLREEFESHIALQTEANIRRGMNPDEAHRAARLAFGPAEHFKEDARDEFRSALLAGFAQDLRYGLRSALRAPLLSGAAVFTLAVAFALSTTAFSATNSVLFRPLPYHDPYRLALIWGTQRDHGGLEPASFTNASDWRRDTRAFESLAMFSCSAPPIVSAPAGPMRAPTMLVSGDFFHVLGARAAIGRLLDSTDQAAGAAPSVELTWEIWRDRFGADSSLVGRTVVLDAVPVRIAGVLAADFVPLPTRLACRPAIYRPLDSRYDDRQRTWSFLKVVARLAPAATVGEAQAELDVQNAVLARKFPASNGGRGAMVVSLDDYLAGPLKGMLGFVQAGALLVLLIACANVAGLLVGRSATRRREFSIRIAMGAGRARIMRQVAAECLLLALAAGAAGAVLTTVGCSAVTALASDALPDPRGLTADWRVVTFGGAVVILVCVALSVAVASAATTGTGALAGALRDGGRVVRRRTALGRAVVAVQLGLAVVVVMGAGLLARSYARLRAVDPGFAATQVMTARVTLPDAVYPRGERQVRFFEQVLTTLGSRPGVSAAGAVSVLPESWNFDHTVVRVVGREYAPGTAPEPDVYRVTPGYFATLQIPLRRGRYLTADDDARHPPVMVIGETMAKRLFGSDDPLGRMIWTGAGSVDRRVVGVVGDVYQYGLDAARTMQFYVSHADNSGSDLTLVVRSTLPDGAVAREVREAVRGVDPQVPVDDLRSMDDVLLASSGRRRLLAGLALAFAVGAMVLAGVGLYGIVAISVADRTPEFGIRMALGADRASVLRDVAGDTLRLLAPSAIAGLLGAAAAGRLMSSLLFQLPANDIASFAAAGGALALIAAVASLVPARRATQVDPVAALRGG